MGKTANTAYLLPGEKVTEDASGSIIEAERQYQVMTNFAETASTVMGATGLPANNSVHPSFPTLRVAARSPQMDENGIRWVVTVTYKTIPQAGNDPSMRLNRIEYGTHSIQEDILYNKGNNLPILDANKKPFESTIQEAVEYPYIKIVKQQKTISRDTLLDRSGTINNAAVVVANVPVAKHTGRIKIVATENPSSDWPWEVSYEIMIKKNLIYRYMDFDLILQDGPGQLGWDMTIINRGYYYYEAGNGNLLRAKEALLNDDGDIVEWRPSASPVPLDTDGTRLAEGVTPIQILVQTIRESDWSGLGLNNL